VIWLLTSGWVDYLIIRFRIRMPEIGSRIRILIIRIPIEDMAVSMIPVPAIMKRETNTVNKALKR